MRRLRGMVLFLRLSDSAADTKTRAASSAAVGVEDIGFWLLVSAYVFRQMYCTTYGKYPLVLCSGNRSRAADCCWGAAFVETNFQEIEKNIKNKEILIKTAE